MLTERMVPAWPCTAGGGNPGRSVLGSSIVAAPSFSAAGTQPDPITSATSCASTPVSSWRRCAARAARPYGSGTATGSSAPAGEEAMTRDPSVAGAAANWSGGCSEGDLAGTHELRPNRREEGG